MVLDIKQKKRVSLFVIIVAIILISNYLVMNIAAYQPVTIHLALATLLDLTIILPLAFYVIILRKRHSVFYIIPAVLIGFWIAYFFIPNYIFEQFKIIMFVIYGIELLFILLEFFILIKTLKKFPQFKMKFNELEASYPQFQLKLRKSLESVFSSKLANIVSTDISVFYFGLFSWKRRGEITGNHIFSYHKNTGYLAFVIMLAHALIIEMIGVHFLIAQKSVVWAWVFTSFDLITAVFLVADYRASMRSPITVTHDHLNIVIGVRRSIEVPISGIKSIKKTTTTPKIRKSEKNSFYATLPQLIEDDDPVFEISLNYPIQAIYMYGMKKDIEKIYITVDRNEDFYQYIVNSMERDEKGIQ
ncbi:hypothetical protein FZW96_15685 [Bacillus sp. BGMRC 2118]|nr:hypothetical protein FZW96_15685 [Bacillus sp. BGMRC 2118]